MNFIQKSILILLLSFLVISCGFRSEKDDLPALGPLEAKFSWITTGIFQRKCIECHQSTGNASHVPLTYRELLNSPRDLVLPGNAEESGLYIALVRTDEKKMPPSEPLTQEEIETVKTWIMEGALEN